MDIKIVQLPGRRKKCQRFHVFIFLEYQKALKGGNENEIKKAEKAVDDAGKVNLI